MIYFCLKGDNCPIGIIVLRGNCSSGYFSQWFAEGSCLRGVVIPKVIVPGVVVSVVVVKGYLTYNPVKTVTCETCN